MLVHHIYSLWVYYQLHRGDYFQHHWPLISSVFCLERFISPKAGTGPTGPRAFGVFLFPGDPLGVSQPIGVSIIRFRCGCLNLVGDATLIACSRIIRCNSTRYIITLSASLFIYILLIKIYHRSYARYADDPVLPKNLFMRRRLSELLLGLDRSLISKSSIINSGDHFPKPK